MWRPWMGYHFHLRPADMIDLTLSQIIEMHDAKQELEDSGP